MKSIVILFGGVGTNACAIVQAIQNGKLNLKCLGAISHVAGAPGIERLQKLGVNVDTIAHQAFASRHDFEQALAAQIKSFAPDIIVLAGFMRILSPEFIDTFKNKIINIHPSLLPKHRGLNTHQRVLEAKEKHHGATVHMVTPDLDAGPILGQSKIDVLEHDTAESLQLRLKPIEHKLYIQVLQQLSASPSSFDLMNTGVNLESSN